MRQRKANIASSYQNHFCLSLQALWKWTSSFSFFFLIRNRCLPFPHSKHLRVSHLPYRVRPWSLYTLSFQNTPLQIFGQLRVSIYLSRCFWLEPNVCCASKKLKTLQTATFKKKKGKKRKRSISPPASPQLIILDIICNLPLLCSSLHHLVAHINTSPMP